MKQNKNEIFFTISGVVAIIYGIIACITIIGLIIGIPLIIAGKKYFGWAKNTDEELLKDKQSIVIWGIVLSIFAFPFGLVALVPVFNLEGELENIIKPKSSSNNSNGTMEKLNKLSNLREKGVIDEEEFKAAKAKILSE